MPPELLEQATAQVNRWIDEGEIVYLHCRAGWQRSAAVAAGAIAIRDGVDLDEALRRIQEQRSPPTRSPTSAKTGPWFDARVSSQPGY